MNEKSLVVAIASGPSDATVVVASPRYQRASRLAEWMSKSKLTDSRDWALVVRDLRRFPRQGRFEELQKWLDDACRDVRTLIGAADQTLIVADIGNEISGLSLGAGLERWGRVTRPGRRELHLLSVVSGRAWPTFVAGEGTCIGRLRIFASLFELMPEGGPVRLKVEPKGALADELRRELAAGAAKRPGEAPAPMLVAAALASYALAQYADAEPLRVA